MTALLRRLVAEALGTALLVATVVGSGIMGDRLSDDAGVTLLANALTTGAGLLVLITILAPVSGAHFNPVVSLVMCLRRELPPAEAASYATAQIAGGVAGVLAAHLMFELPVLQLSSTLRTGPAQWFAEAVATFGLILAILGSSRAPGANVSLIVAAYITAAYWFTASTSFANPAVTIARMLSDTFAGIRPADAPMFILAQLAGAVAGAGLGAWLFPAAVPAQAGHGERSA
jgi:glycerol uptake facilitator-like aquaporin